jgi:hypothetical protein
MPLAYLEIFAIAHQANTVRRTKWSSSIQQEIQDIIDFNKTYNFHNTLNNLQQFFCK